VTARPPNRQLAPNQSNDYDRRSRLVSLAYDVLRDMKVPVDATDEAMLSLLSRAFLAKAVAELEPLKVKGSKPVSMFSLDPLARRRALESPH
jgi:hypothetical protein